MNTYEQVPVLLSLIIYIDLLCIANYMEAMVYAWRDKFIVTVLGSICSLYCTIGHEYLGYAYIVTPTFLQLCLMPSMVEVTY
jgi:hypothetical protein